MVTGTPNMVHHPGLCLAMNNDDRQRTSVDDVQPIFVSNEVNIEERTNDLSNALD